MSGSAKAKPLRRSLLLAKLTTRSMTCAICGNALPCAHSRRNTAVLLEETGYSPADRAAQPKTPDPENWRREVVSRVEQHRLRRRRRSDPNAPELDFPVPDLLAEDPLAEQENPAWAEPHGGPAAEDQTLYIGPEDTMPGVYGESSRSGTPKVIRFPVPPFARITADEPSFAVRRSEAGEAAPHPDVPSIFNSDITDSPDVMDAPRIMDAGPFAATEFVDSAMPIPVAPPAEQMELLPSFDDIQLDEPAPRLEEKPELMSEPAPLGQRMVAGAIDLGIVFVASLAFNTIFARLAEASPNSRTATLCTLATGGLLWLLYEYLFLAHGNGTPGMLLTQLQLATFDGRPVSRKGRRLRALASGLCGFSLGLGFGWALVDEDQLGWHDRMTGTMLKSGIPRDGKDPDESLL